MAASAHHQRADRSREQLTKWIKSVAFGFTRSRNHRVRVLLYAGNPNRDLLATIKSAESEEPFKLTTPSDYPGRGRDRMGDPRTIELRPEPATREAFAPYGVIPPFEGDGFPTADLVFTRDDGWVNFIGHTLAEIEVRDGRLRCELLNRHDTHTQTLMPMSGDALVVVAPPRVDFSEAGHFDTVKAFALPQHACVHLHRGTWHWGPYPVGANEVRVFNIQARGWPTDNGVAELTRDHGVVYEVIT